LATASTAHEVAQAWREHAYDLVQWTLQRLVNRSDVYGHYPDRGPDDPCVLPEAVRGTLTERRLGRHYAATSRGHIVAVHALSAEQTARWMLIGFRRRTEGDAAATPGVNFDIALQWHERLRTLGFDPILEDGDGQGGYRLLTLFDEPAAATAVLTFARQITVDYADKGLTEPPRLVPGEASEDESWLRLPGLHPGGSHASRVWDGDRWLDGAEAVTALLRAKATPPTFLRVPRPTTQSPERAPAEPGRPVVTPRAAPVDTRRRATKAALADTAVLPAIAVPPTHAVAVNLNPQPREEASDMIATAKPDTPRTSAVTSDAPDAIVATIAQRTGMRESEITRRLFAWFSEQDEVVQALVLGQIPQALRPNAAQVLVERFAAAG
jgi:hypothetical protein